MSVLGKTVIIAAGVGLLGFLFSELGQHLRASVSSSRPELTTEQILQKEKEDRLAAQQLAEDQQQAVIFNVTVEKYRAAKNKVNQAGNNCAYLIASHQGLAVSEWERRVSASFVDRWYMEGPDTMVVAGNNMRTKNVGIPRVINYKCRASVDRAESLYSDMRLVTD